MAGPRFLLVNGVALPDQSRRPWAAGPTDPLDARVPARSLGIGERSVWVAWRLLGRNNRELGRSPLTYRSIPACLGAIVRLKAGVDDATRVLAVDPEDGRWLWRLDSLGEPVAVSSRSYQRQRESLYSLNQFVAGAIEGTLPAVEVELPSAACRPDAPPAAERAWPDVAPAVATVVAPIVAQVVAPIVAQVIAPVVPPTVAPVRRGHLRVAGGMAS